MFRNRTEAGRLLGNALLPFRVQNAIVLAIPGGGVPVGREVADILGSELDVIVTRKIGAPGNPEYAIGSVTQDGQIITDMRLLEELHISHDYLESEAATQLEKIRNSLKKYRGMKAYPELEGRTAVIVDDGIATGSTMRAAIQSARKMSASTIIAAVPVGPRDTIAKLSKLADRVVCLMSPVNFFAVGDYYSEFEQVDEETVSRMLGGSGTTSGSGQVSIPR